MKKIVVAVYAKISGNVTFAVENAFYKAVFLEISNYFENGAYGVVIDLPDAPCYKSFGDGEVESAVSRCYGALPIKYREKTFVIVRARRYNVKNGRTAAFSCENGAYGAIFELLSGKTEYCLLLGNLPEDYDFLYFSGSVGMIETGGIKELLRAADSTGKNVFPLIKIAKNDYNAFKRGQKCYFSALEGLYCRKTACGDDIRSLPESDALLKNNILMKNNILPKNGIWNKKNTATRKRSVAYKNSGMLLKSVFVLDIPKYTDCKDSKITFKRKKDYSRAAYRAALAASRIFIKIIEKDCVSVNSAEDAACALNALIAMRIFGFLGEKELLKSSEALMDIIEEAFCVRFEMEGAAKVLFLLTAPLGAYSEFAVTEALFWPLKLRIRKLYSMLISRISLKNGENDNVYLIMCCNNVIPDINVKCVMPRVMQAMLSENEGDLYLNGKSIFEDIESALCVLVCAVNVCYHENFKSFLFNVPVFKAKSSYLSRMSKKEADVKALLSERSSEKEDLSVPFYGFYQKGLRPVKERLFQSGSDPCLIPYAAYIERLVSQIPTRKDGTSVKICYISSNISSLLRNLLRTFQMIPNISVCVILDNRYAFNKAKGEFNGKAKFLLSEEKEQCEEVKRNSSFVRRLTFDTTLSELMEEAREKSRFRANVKSVPDTFSHRLFGGGDLKSGFCTFLPSGENVSYGEFIKNPFTEIKSVQVSFVPKLRAKLLKVTFNDAKYRNGSEFSLLLENGEILTPGEEKALGSGEKITVLKLDTGDGLLFAVQIFKNRKEKEYLKTRILEDVFFESCDAIVKRENETERRHAEILREFLEQRFFDETRNQFFICGLRSVGGKCLPYSFFGKIILLSGMGELKGERLALAAKRYAAEFRDYKIFNICLPARYTRGETAKYARGETATILWENAEKELRENNGGKLRESGGKELRENNEENLRESGENELLKNSKKELWESAKKNFSENGEKEYRYPFYIHCLDRIKRAREQSGGATLGADSAKEEFERFMGLGGEKSN